MTYSFLYNHITNSKTCSLKTGVRPLIKPSDEPHTVILNGRTDNRNYKEDQTDQYKDVDVTELITELGSCAIPYPTPSEQRNNLKNRIGSSAAFVDDRIILCGGFSNENMSYANLCQYQSGMYLVFL